MNSSAATLPRVVHALAPGPIGGLESVVALLAREWAGRGGAVALAMTLQPGASIPANLESLASCGVELFPHSPAARAYWQERADFRNTFQRWAPSVIHTHGYRADILAGSAARSLGIPQVTTLHGFTGGDWKNRLYQYLQVGAARRSSAAIAVSGPVRDHLIRVGVRAERVHLIPNAWSPAHPFLDRRAARAELGLAADAVAIGWIGRLSHEKGADVLVSSVPLLEDTAWQISVVGEGGERPALQHQAERLGVADRIRWHGIVPEAARCYAAFDCIVLSSRTEGTPIVLLEAMSAGVPLVTTRVGGVPDVVGESEAHLVPSENPAALAAAIGRVLREKVETASRVARAGERVRRDFAPGPWLERHAELYRALVAQRAGASQ